MNLADVQDAAARVTNWGRWGDDDELGTLNLAGAPRINPLRMMSAINKEVSGPVRYNDDYVVMPLQAASQWDTLAHVTYDGAMYNGRPATAVTCDGARHGSIDHIAHSANVVGRGVLLDVARARGVAMLEPDAVIPPEELSAVAAAEGVEIRGGDIVVVRTGWRLAFVEHGATGWAARSPGLSWRCAEWCHERDVAAVASDNVAVEVRVPEIAGVALPFHMLALRDMGMPLGEIWDLEALAIDCAADGVYDFFLTATALPFTSGAGTPVNPIAIK